MIMQGMAFKIKLLFSDMGKENDASDISLHNYFQFHYDIIIVIYWND